MDKKPGIIPPDYRVNTPEPQMEVLDTPDYASSGVDAMQALDYAAPPPKQLKPGLQQTKPFVVIVVVIISILLLGTGALSLISKKSGKSALQSTDYGQSNVSLGGIPQLSNISKAATLAIHGQLQVENSVVITPTSKPTNPVVGQIYFDKNSKQLLYYNGSSFQSLGGQVTNITNNSFGTQGSGTPGAAASSPSVFLQASSPGTAQVGNFAISGIGTANTLQGTTVITSSLDSTGGTLSVGTANAGAVSIGRGGITTTVNGGLQVSQAASFGSDLTVGNLGNVAFQRGSDFATVGSSNNVNFGTGALFRLTGGSAQTITGIAGGTDGRVMRIVNAGSNAAVLANNSGNSLAANRITTGTGSDISLPPDASVSLVYDSAASVWRVVGSVTAAGAGGSFVTLQASSPGSPDTGNLNISGSGTLGSLSVAGAAVVGGSLTAASLQGNGSAVTNLDASNLTTGTIASAVVSGAYGGITQVGTLGSLSVTGGGAFGSTVSGADATSNNQFVTLSQLNTAISGAGSGVTSLNTLVGGLSLQGTAGQVSISSNGTNTLTLALNPSVTLQGNSFNGINQLVKLDASGHLPVLDASALTNLNASNLATGTVASGLVSGAYSGITTVGTLGALSVTGTGAFGSTVSGADATSNNQFVTLSQLNGAVGGISAVSSLNALTGSLNVQGTAGQVSVSSNGTDTLTLAVGASVTLQGNSFNGAKLYQVMAQTHLP